MSVPSEWTLARLNNQAFPLNEKRRYLEAAAATFRSPEGLGLSLAKLDTVIARFATEVGVIGLAYENMSVGERNAWFDAIDACVDVLCEEYYAITEVRHGLFMFWDAIVSLAWTPQIREAVSERLWQIIKRQLQVDNIFVRASALHGIGHLRPPGARKAVAEVIDLKGTDDLADYARQALAGKVL